MEVMIVMLMIVMITTAPAPPLRPLQSCSRRRFSLGADRGSNNGRLVSWLGWTFFTTVRPSTGLAIMDIRFKGNRIAHELSLTEAVAYYSGSGGDQVMYLDSAYSMTQLGNTVIPGVDCPADAAYINGTMWAYQQDSTGRDGSRFRTSPNGDGNVGNNHGNSNAANKPAAKTVRADPTRASAVRMACVFERDSAGALWRHTEDQSPGKASHGVRGTSLIVRMVSTVANYDYLTEVEFLVDGTVKVSLTFAGYCEIRWYGKEMNAYEKDLRWVGVRLKWIG